MGHQQYFLHACNAICCVVCMTILQLSIGKYKSFKQEMFYLFRYTLWWRKDSEPLLWLSFYLNSKNTKKIMLGLIMASTEGTKKLLPQFFCGNTFLLLQHCSKTKAIWFCCIVAATSFYVANNKNLFESAWVTCTLFLVLPTQHIALQAPEKHCRCPLSIKLRKA